MEIKQLKNKDIKPLREQILKEQNEICPICKKKINSPVLDHHHSKKVKGTGQIRGVVCLGCNIMIGKVENNCMRYNISQQELPVVLINISEYLEKDQYPYIHPSEKTPEPKLKKSSYNKLKKVYSGKAKFPEYPKSKKLIKPLKKLYKKYKLEPEFYNK